MERITRFFLDNKAFTWLLLALVAAGGMVAYTRMGKLEDAPFTIKQAQVITKYPGASPMEVRSQVTDVLEESIQSLGELYYLKTENRTGLSKITVYVKKEIRADQMQQLWDKLRRKVADVQSRLPQGAGPSVVNDDFGDVMGVFYALESETLSNRELERLATDLKNEILKVDDVSRVELFGVLDPTVEVTLSPSLMAVTGIRTEDIAAAFARQNAVVDAGGAYSGQHRLRIDAAGSFESLEDIANMVVTTRGGEYFRLADIAQVTESYASPARNMMFVGDVPAIGIAVSTVPDGNVVDMAADVAACVGRFSAGLPQGCRAVKIYDQGEQSARANDGFVANLVLSVLTVVAILLFFIGFRNGMLVGCGLVFSILLTLIYMWLDGIALQRMSLAAIIIAMGMLVDNAIVVFDSALVNMSRGMDRKTAVLKAVSSTALPLLAATVIAVLTFVPIYLSPHVTGEMMSSLVIVIAVSLFASWIFAVSQNAFFIQEFVAAPVPAAGGKELYSSKGYVLFRKSLKAAIAHRKALLAAVVLVLALSLWAFRFVPRVFVPELSKEYITADMWMPEGTRIEAMRDLALSLSDCVRSQEGVKKVSLFVGQTPPRYYLANAAFGPQPNYAHAVIEASSPKEARRLYGELAPLLKEHFPELSVRVNRFNLNSVPEALIEARFCGEDPAVLDSLVRAAMDIMRSDPDAVNVHNEWGNMAMAVRAEYDPVKAGRLGISKAAVMESVKSASDGLPVGIYRDGDKKVPVVVCSGDSLDADTGMLGNFPVWNGDRSAPLSQVASDVSVCWEWPLLKTYDRSLSMSAMCDVAPGATMAQVHSRIRDRVEAISLPAGYSFFWDSQFKDEKEAKAALLKYFPMAGIVLVVILVALFGNFRQPLVVVLMLPLSLVGVVAGLLATGSAFGFFPIAGWLGLLGMIVKNVIVLIDEMNVQVKAGADPSDAVVDAAVSRMRPVLMAASTTVLGMVPLLWDVVFGGMASAIIFGLTFATLLTLYVAPVLLSVFYCRKTNHKGVSEQ